MMGARGPVVSVHHITRHQASSPPLPDYGATWGAPVLIDAAATNILYSWDMHTEPNGGEDIVIVTGNRYIYRSVDGGASFTKVYNVGRTTSLVRTSIGYIGYTGYNAPGCFIRR